VCETSDRDEGQSEDAATSLGVEPSVVEQASDPPPPRVVLLTGLSGSGKSTAIRALEDLGFFCIDNLPVPLLPKVIELAAGGGSLQALAFVIDTRGRQFLSEAGQMVERLRDEGVPMRIAFLEAADDELVRRFSETRRRHPLGEEGVTLREGIRREREQLSELRHRADEVIDTSSHTVHTLKALIQKRYGGDQEATLQVTVLSFGFKHGVPVECDLVFDVRFLPNPYFVEGLRPLTGRDQDVSDYIFSYAETNRFLSLFQEMVDFMLPMYEREGKSYLTIGLGCTGGRHRSVALCETIAERLEIRGWQASLRHRDLPD
jgi:RNase adapter protein RapZ